MGKDINELASYMRPLVIELLKRATDAGIDPVVEDTGRTPEEQKGKLALHVSWTIRSRHLPQPPEELSEAIDIVPRACITMKFWGWNGDVGSSHPHWGILIGIGESLGLRCGVHFPSVQAPHSTSTHLGR